MTTPLHAATIEAVTALQEVPDLPILGANTTAILIAVGLVLFILLLLFTGKKKGGAAAIEVDERKKLDAEPEARPKSMPASKEVFAPLPPSEPVKATKAAAKVVAPEPEEGEQGEDGEDELAEGEIPWELLEDGDPRKVAGKKPAAQKAEKKVEQKKVEQKKAEPAVVEAPRPELKKDAEKVAEVKPLDGETEEQKKARLDAEKARKKAEEERHAEAARQAEARDKALKLEAERVKAEAKAAAEAEAREKAEARKREAAAKAEQDQKKKAEDDKKKADELKAKPSKDSKDKDKKPEAGLNKLEIEEPAKTLRDGLGRTRKEGFIARLGSLFAGKQIDQDLMDEVEEALFTADIGIRTADRLLQAVKDALSKKELKDASKVWDVLRAEAQKILEGAAGKPIVQPKPGEPMVTMVLGVNGTGKTTSIGKLAHKLIADGRRVTLVAGDTFRAAAAEQLEHWARRVGAPCIKGKEGADPASVVFDGVKQAVEEHAEFVLVDTAGRLHNNVNLMEELKKVRRVMGRAIESAPHEVLMVLDATTGQNGITQAKLFKEATDVTGIILTKLDGTAKGGVVLGVCDELKIPIRWIGVGERVSDLRAFDPKEFVDELFAPPT